MSGTAQKTDPKLWDKVKADVTEGDKGGRPGQWSARKAQMATAEYKKAGGGYRGGRSDDNHLKQWTGEEWGTQSGHASGETGERYLPKEARESLTDAEYAASTAKKRADTEKGRQFSRQPKAAAEKSAAVRADGAAGTKAALMAKARAQGVPGRSKMSKADLARAVHT